MISYTITDIRHLCAEQNNFVINRPHGRNDYTFLHFLNNADILINNEIKTAHTGSFIIFPPYTPQYFCSKGPLLHNWFHADESLQKYMDMYNIRANRLYTPKNSQHISELIHIMDREFFSNRPNKKDMLSAQLNELFILLARSCVDIRETDVMPYAQREKLSAVRREIICRTNENWTVKKMAELANMSEPYFFSLYKKMFGETPTTTLIMYRVHFSRLELMNTNDSVQQIALRMGYTNEYHFIRQFKKLTGKTPGQFQEEYRKRSAR